MNSVFWNLTQYVCIYVRINTAS